MKQLTCLVLLALALASFGACGKEEGGSGAAAGSGLLSKYPGTEDGARQLLTDIRSGDAKAMTAALRPTADDFKAVFTEDVRVMVQAEYDKLWSDPNAVIVADPANTELALWKASTEELQQWSDAAQANFPGGYESAAAKLMPGLVVYRWKYVKPGETMGMAYDGLIHVNGRWTWYPKPWRVLSGD
jgi:hypothetical protein